MANAPYPEPASPGAAVLRPVGRRPGTCPAPSAPRSSRGGRRGPCCRRAWPATLPLTSMVAPWSSFGTTTGLVKRTPYSTTAPGSPTQSVTTRIASAIVNMPCAMTSGRPTSTGELLVPVDRVEVPGGARVLDEGGAGHGKGLGGQLGADLYVVVGDPRGTVRGIGGHAGQPSSAARATSLVQAVTTCSPASSWTSPRMSRISLPAMDLIASMVEVTVSRSPARTGRT